MAIFLAIPLNVFIWIDSVYQVYHGESGSIGNEKKVELNVGV